MYENIPTQIIVFHKKKTHSRLYYKKIRSNSGCTQSFLFVFEGYYKTKKIDAVTYTQIYTNYEENMICGNCKTLRKSMEMTKIHNKVALMCH